MSNEEATLLLDKTLDRDLVLHSICPTQDIIACAYVDQIICHRLHWQKLWSFPIPPGNAQPSAIAWHPNATCLAIGFGDGKLIQLELEKGVKMQEMDFQERVLSIQWLGISLSANQGHASHSIFLSSPRAFSSYIPHDWIWCDTQ